MTTDASLPRQTSVPRWPATAPELDASGTSWVIVGIGARARPDVEAWLAQAAALRGTCHVLQLEQADQSARERLTDLLARTRVGARIAVSGDEADVLAVAAWARQEGVIGEEITLHAVSRVQLVVFCVHCEATHRVAAGTERSTCPACARTLELHEHASGHRGTYLAASPDPVAEVIDLRDPRDAPAPARVRS